MHLIMHTQCECHKVANMHNIMQLALLTIIHKPGKYVTGCMNYQRIPNCLSDKSSYFEGVTIACSYWG